MSTWAHFSNEPGLEMEVEGCKRERERERERAVLKKGKFDEANEIRSISLSYMTLRLSLREFPAIRPLI